MCMTACCRTVLWLSYEQYYRCNSTMSVKLGMCHTISEHHIFLFCNPLSVIPMWWWWYKFWKQKQYNWRLNKLWTVCCWHSYTFLRNTENNEGQPWGTGYEYWWGGRAYRCTCYRWVVCIMPWQLQVWEKSIECPLWEAGLLFGEVFCHFLESSLISTVLWHVVQSHY